MQTSTTESSLNQAEF